MQLNLNFNPIKKNRRPIFGNKLIDYKKLSIHERINLKSWEHESIKGFVYTFSDFINQSLLLVNIFNNRYYIENQKRL